jgi:ABC-type nitrate/sulfonate/bicarbonate transport system permease component
MSTPDCTTPVAAPPAMAPRAAPYTGRLRLRRLTGSWVPAVLIVLVFLGVWEGYVRLWAVPKWLLPAPSVIAMTLVVSWELLLDHTLVTLLEVVVGFALSLLGGVLLACGIAGSRTLERALYPFVIASQMVPIIVIAPLLLIWVGYGLTPKLIVVALTAFFPIVVNMVDGLKSVDPDAVNLLRTMGASRWQIFVKVQMPTSLPFLFSGLRVAMAVSVIGAVIGEWMGSSQGLGYLMIRSKPQFLTERVFAAIVVLSAMGVGLFALVGVVEKLAIPWWHNEQRQRSLSQEE